ncbi:MAG: PfkB family carbohydrate kinase [Dehalococcoidia bacterium]|nr:PfkB family carbohydrate kinase [Dehalococcoidia bacterium]
MGMAPDFVVAGHLTLDTDNAGYLLGGTAYSALTAARLGRRVGLFTSFASDVEPGPDLEGVQVVSRPSPRSTIFRNTYKARRREQSVLSVALPLEASELPLSWRRASVVHLAPMANELGPEFLETFPGALIGASPQGWMRDWGPDGLVRPAPWSWAEQALPRLDALILSLDDLAGDEAIIAQWATKVPCLVLTCGEAGAWVYYKGERRHVAACPSRRIVDPTGAGDVFAAAFLVKWAEWGDPVPAARFAGLVASFVVEEKGLAGVPTLAQVEECWARQCNQGRS